MGKSGRLGMGRYIVYTSKLLLNRNGYLMGNINRKVCPKRVNINYWDRSIEKPDGLHNLGDMLSPVVIGYVLQSLGIELEKEVASTKHLYAIGSIIGQGFADATIWGSGFLFDPGDSFLMKIKYRYMRKLDIRCVRGPQTRAVFTRLGIDCPDKYGDPACLMPLFYKPNVQKEREYRVVLHFRNEMQCDDALGILTNNYKQFIDEICKAKLIISGSLHGIILAESYGIPAIFLQDRRSIYMIKYQDWYESTGRKSFPIASSIEEALSMVPPEVPDLRDMQQMLLKTFPADLWD